MEEKEKEKKREREREKRMQKDHDGARFLLVVALDAAGAKHHVQAAKVAIGDGHQGHEDEGPPGGAQQLRLDAEEEQEDEDGADQHREELRSGLRK